MNQAIKKALALTAHIMAMQDDAYLNKHPEWNDIVKESLDVGEYLSTYEISGE